MNRLNRILIILLGLQLIIALLVYWPRGVAASLDEDLLENFDPAEVAIFSVEDDTGNLIQFEKKAGAWVLAIAGDYPAKSEVIEPLLEKISAIKTNRLVSQTPASHTRLQVAEGDYQRRLALELNDGSKFNLLIGSSAGSNATHVRLVDQDAVYLTGEITPWEFRTQASQWIDTTYLSLPRDNISGVVLENAQGKFEFIRDEDDIWNFLELPEGETFNESKFTTLLGRLANFRMTAPLGKEEIAAYGLENPAARLEVIVEDEAATTIHSIRIGAQDENSKNYYVHASDSDYYVRVAETTVKDLIESTLEDFILVEPTPTPTTES